MNTDFLNEDWEVNGNNEQSLLKAANTLSLNSDVVKIENPEKIIIFAVYEVTSKGLYVLKLCPEKCTSERLFPLNRKAEGDSEKDTELITWKGARSETYFENHNYYFISYVKLKDLYGINDNIIREIQERGYYMVLTENEQEKLLLFPSKSFLTSFCKRFNMSFSKTIKTAPKDPIFFILLANWMNDLQPFSIFYRMGVSSGKAFSCFSENYYYQPQNTVIKEVLDLLKKKYNLIVSYYEMNHEFTMIRMDIPDDICKINGKRIMPCIIFSLSEIGNASYTLQAGISINGKFIPLGSPLSKVHKGKVKFDSIIEEFVLKYEAVRSLLNSIKRISAEEMVYPKDAMMNLLTSVKSSVKIDTSLSNVLNIFIENLPDEKISKQEMLLCLLYMPGDIETIYRKETKKISIEKNLKRRLGEKAGYCEDESGKILAQCNREKIALLVGEILMKTVW